MFESDKLLGHSALTSEECTPEDTYYIFYCDERLRHSAHRLRGQSSVCTLEYSYYVFESDELLG